MEEKKSLNTSFIGRLLDLSIVKFFLVGIVNTLVGLSAMFICMFVLSHTWPNHDTIIYWISSAVNVIVGSIVSYILNKRFTFNSNTKGKEDMIPFVINIVVCYFIAYGIAKPVGLLLFHPQSNLLKNIISLLFGSVFFTLINYFGQRFWVFKEKK